MLKLKPMQNSETKENWKDGKKTFQATVVTTMTKLIAYNSKGEVIAKSGCKYAKDFDYDALLKAARKKPEEYN